MLPQTVSRFVQRYAGVQGFYFINRNADLGFIRPVDAKPVKETFPQLHDRKFTRKHPTFLSELENFLRDLQELSYVYLNSVETGMELGYIVPAGDDEHEWQSATLMAHKRVVDAIHLDQEGKHPDDVAGASRYNLTAEKLQGECSVHRGLNYLAEYVNTNRSYVFFPVLFFQPAHPTTDTRAGDMRDPCHDTSLRVLNLLWPRMRNENGSTVHHDLIFNILRRNLEVRGALARQESHAESRDPLMAARKLAKTESLTPQ